MSRCRFNWQRADSFEWKFKRKPKLHTISEVHDLYLRAMERSAKKSKEIVDCIAEIVRDIPPTAAYNNRYNDSYITYFYSDDVLYQYKMTYEESYGSYGTSSDRVKFNQGSVEEIRDKKIHFILNNQRALELGEKYKRLCNANKHYHYTVKEAFELMIVEKLEEKYKKVNSVNMPKAIPVVVENRRYIFAVDPQSYGTYKKFIFLGEVNEDIVLD
jgi:hypothetical protein